MKIYTNTIDLAQPTLKRFWVAPHSDFKLGVKIVKGTETVDKDITVTEGTNTLTPDDDKIDGFTVYTLSSGDTGAVEYTITVDGLTSKYTVMQFTTDSTVFEKDATGGGGGGDLSEYAKKTWVEEQISGFADESELTAYYAKSETSSATEIGTALEGKQPAGNYLTAETEPAFAAVSADLVVDGDLTAYYTKSETSSATEIAEAIAGAGGGGSALSSFAVSEKPVACSALIREALDNKICLPETIYEDTNGELHVLDISGDVDFCEGRIGSSANLLSSAVRVNVGTNISAMHGRTFGWTSNLTSLVIPEGVAGAANGNNCNEMFTSSKLNTISATVQFPDSWASFGSGSPFWNTSNITFDFGDTRKTIPVIGNASTNSNPEKACYVPDNLYNQWINTSGWTNHSNTPILPRSAMTASQRVMKQKNGNAPLVDNIMSIYETDWASLSASADTNTMYVVLPDPE